jgi:antitoxin HicB
MKYHFKTHKENNELWAECIELKGCDTQSEDGTIENLRKNMEEALNLYLDEPDQRVTFPMPEASLKGEEIISVPVEPRIAFALALRHERAVHHLTQKQMADMLGMKNIWSYQKLESPKKANPQLSTIARIIRVFSDFNPEWIFN